MAGKRFTAKQIRAHFFASVDTSPHPNGCYIWTAGYCGSSGGYGRYRGKQATHYAWFYAKGRWPPKGKQLCHTCDTPLCVNVDHLFKGTARTNKDDQIAKGRVPRGETHWSKQWGNASMQRGEGHWTHRKPHLIARGDRSGAKLHPESTRRGSACHQSKIDEKCARKIKQLLALDFYTYKQIAEKVGKGATEYIVQFIKSGRSWKHV